ncbi:uncharacterized protein LOC127745664 isoform X2 [Arachis duranensis]|uniref:Uncharacterized protein LOC127745664 isoform X2 n=1 Tax=Arachis duranensis TaxID=130453 RepID=A0A9C6TTP9_ARADU|nr:uncharacterized protein LOC127745664 isoform X2 [Arachis duranensis]
MWAPFFLLGHQGWARLYGLIYLLNPLRSCHCHFLHLQAPAPSLLCAAPLLLLFLPCTARFATDVIPLVYSPSSCSSLLELASCSAWTFDEASMDHSKELLELGEAVGTQSRGLTQEQISMLPVSSKYKCGFFSRKKSRDERLVLYVTEKCFSQQK